MAEINVEKTWNFGTKDLTATTTIYEVLELRGGESVTIKALTGNSGSVYIGSNSTLKTTNGYELANGEAVTFTLPISFGKGNYIKIYAVCATAGDDVCYIKLIDLAPETAAAT